MLFYAVFRKLTDRRISLTIDSKIEPIKPMCSILSMYFFKQIEAKLFYSSRYIEEINRLIDRSLLEIQMQCEEFYF